jgi:hypothetical protein
MHAHGGTRPRGSPAHAGPLRLWERLTIALLFVLVGGVIVALSLPPGGLRKGQPQASQAGLRKAGTGYTQASKKTGAAPGRSALADGWGSAVLTGPHGIRFEYTAEGNGRLAAALAPVLRHHTGILAVGVVDASTGAVAVFRGSRPFHTASIVKADILAALLFQHQQTGIPLSEQQQALAAQMMEDSSDQAASELWIQIGEASGLNYANEELGLKHTKPGSGAFWGLTSTTVDDQLRLLADLASSNSPLWPESRSYELGLMRRVAAGQAWGVTAAAAPGTSPAVKDGWLPDGSETTWVINSIGLISRDGHEILVAILSSDQPSESAGIARADAAAKAAVSAITGSRARA